MLYIVLSLFLLALTIVAIIVELQRLKAYKAMQRKRELFFDAGYSFFKKCIDEEI